VFFSIDAGPHLVAFTLPGSLERVRAALRAHDEIAEIAEVITSGMGGPARLIEAPAEETLAEEGMA
jgi:mevalonate pyrophosphate decarboxylase